MKISNYTVSCVQEEDTLLYNTLSRSFAKTFSFFTGMILCACHAPLHVAPGEWKKDESRQTVLNEQLGLSYKYGNFPYFGSFGHLDNLPVRTADPAAQKDKYMRGVLEDVKFNYRTDTLYFYFSGFLIAYSSPKTDTKTADFFIDLHSFGDSLDRNRPYITDFNTDCKLKGHLLEPCYYPGKNYLFRTYYYQPRKKRWLVKESYQKGAYYMNWVYVYQVRTDKTPDFYSMWDLTKPSHFGAGRDWFMTSKYLTLLNMMREGLLDFIPTKDSKP